jgi:hypothetical protein
MTMQEPFTVQTRSEVTGINFYPTFKAALEEADQDNTIWKISFSLSTGERIRLIKYEDITEKAIWVYEPIVIDYKKEE